MTIEMMLNGNDYKGAHVRREAPSHDMFVHAEEPIIFSKDEIVKHASNTVKERRRRHPIKVFFRGLGRRFLRKKRATHIHNYYHNHNGSDPIITYHDTRTNQDGSRAIASVGDYVIDGVLGNGTFGTVFVGTSKTKKTDDQVAIKKATKSLLAATEMVILGEHGHHANIIGYHVTIQTPHEVFIVMEKATGDLFSMLTRIVQQYDGRQQVLAGMLNAIEYLHSQGIYHLDLKPENILVCSPGTSYTGRIEASDIRIADFGLSKLSSNYGTDTHGHRTYLPIGFRGGTPAFSAPELLLGLGGLAEAADLWSIGATLLDMTGELPCWLLDPTNFTRDVRAFVAANDSSTAEDENEYLYKEFLFHNLLVLDGKRRTCARDLLDHPWLQTSYLVTCVVLESSFV